MRKLNSSYYNDINTFIIDENPLSLSLEDKVDNTGNSSVPIDEYSDLVTELSKILKNNKKEEKTVYRLQHQKASDIEDLMISLIPILDSFQNLLSLAEQFSDNEIVQNWMKSMEAIYKKLIILLGKHGLQPIESIGTPVDFTLHEVVEYRNTPDGITNLVIEEKVKGYKFKGNIIREARVVVANAEGGN